MSGEIIHEHVDGSFTIIASGADAPKVTGHFSNYEQFRTNNSDVFPTPGSITPENPTKRSVVADVLRKLGIIDN